MSEAQEADKAAIRQKFISQIKEHTLDDLNGRAAPAIRESLRASAHIEAWNIELLRLQAQTPKGEFLDKIRAKREEASALIKGIYRERHFNKVADKSRIRAVGSGANLGQMGAVILAAHITAKDVTFPVAATIHDLKELIDGIRAFDNI